MEFADLPPNSMRVSRRRLLLLGTVAAASGLLVMTGGAQVASAAEVMAAAIAPPASQMAQEQTGGTTVVNPAPRVAALQVNAQPVFGPPTDIASGWDGTLWAIDGAGAPHQYDPVQQAWQFYGSGIDAIAPASDTALYAFRDAEVALVAKPAATTADEPTSTPGAATDTPTPVQGGAGQTLQPGVPQSIASLWPNLARTFTLGVEGAASVNGVLYLFKTGRYTRADGSQPPVKLTDLKNWPQGAPWNDGQADLVVGLSQPAAVALIRGDQFVLIDPAAQTVTQAPKPLNSLLPDNLVSGVTSGQVDALLHTAPNAQLTAFTGPAAVEYANGSAPQPSSSTYLPKAFGNWPVTWHPILQHAPSGRQGGLWSAHTDGSILRHDGSGWSQLPGKAVSVAAGADGSAYCIGVGQQSAQQALFRWDGARGDWQTLLTGQGVLAQVAVGDTSRVWTRHADNTVHRLDQSNPNALKLDPVQALGQVTHLSANADGSVWSSDASGNVHRFISEAGLPPEQIQTGGVMKVASSGFGNAHFLVQPGAATGTAEVQQYTSPYVFKTSQGYWAGGNYPIAQGLGNLYLLDSPNPPSSTDAHHWIAAVDAHSGQEVSRSQELTQAFPKTTIVSAPTFDPVHEMVYVALASGNTEDVSTPGLILALDARDLTKVRWQYQTPSSVDASPALLGGLLVFGDRSGTVYALDTNVNPSQPPTKRWSVVPVQDPNQPGQPVPLGPGDSLRVPRPVLVNGRITGLAWATETRGYDAGTGVELCTLWSCRVDGSDFLAQTVVPASSAHYITESHARVYDLPVIGHATFSGTPRTALFFKRVVKHIDDPKNPDDPDNGKRFSQVYAVNLEDPSPYLDGDSLVLQFVKGDTVVLINTELAYDLDGLVWFGAGNALYGLDANKGLQPTFNSAWGQSDEIIVTTPVVYTHRSPNGQPTKSVWFTQLPQGTQPPRLQWVTPAANSNLTELPTGATSASSLALGRDGVLYLAGNGFSTATGQLPQMMGIRIDQLVQNQRDFIIESQLMQDFDDPSEPTHNPSGSARYQTQLTVVDDNKAPQPSATVKIWGDQPMTIRVGNQSFQVGPADSEYANVTTGADGKLTVVSGYLSRDSSDKPDLFAAPLRVWTSFMDPYERILVYPDREFHNRLATAHATPNNDDPLRPNLDGAKSYSGSQLFTPDQQSQGAPGQMAQAINQMTSSVGVGGGGSSRAVAWAQHATATPGAKYIAYDDLPGSSYSPVNISGQRSVAVAQTTGIHLSTGTDGKQPLQLRSLSPADAASTIDGWQGQEWQQSSIAPPAVRGRVGNIFQDFWSWLKGAAVTITDAVISVGKDMVVGIRFLVNGVVHVFQEVIHALEDAVAAIGAFFKQLAIDIANAIEALSVLFNFDEIIQTQQLLLTQLNKVIKGDPTNPTIYPGLDGVIKTTVIPQVNSVFEQGEAAINGFLNQVANQAAGMPVNGLKGQGTTEHTAYTVQPKGGGQPSSQATPATWAQQKFTAGLPANGGSSQMRAPAATTGDQPDPVGAFITTFVNNLTNDPQLSSQWQKVEQGFTNLGGSTSVSDFVRKGVAELLQLLALVLDGVLAVTKAFLDGFLELFTTLISDVMEVASQPIDIPVLSWLYNKLTGEQLSVVSVITLILAFPVTIVWRIVEGQWPSQSLGPSMASATAGAVEAVSPTVAKIMASFDGVARLVMAPVAAVYDADTAEGESLGNGERNIAEVARFMLSAVLVGTTCPYLRTTSSDPAPSPFALARWAVNGITPMVQGVGLSMKSELGTDLAAVRVIAFVYAGLGVVEVVLGAMDLVNNPHGTVAADLDFAAIAAAAFAAILNPVKFIPDFGKAFIVFLDFVMWAASAVLAFVEAGFTQ